MSDLLHAAYLLVLLTPCIVLVVYVLKRFKQFPCKSTNCIKIIDRLSLSHKEYILVVQVENEKLVLGISPTTFRTLHVLKNE